MIGYIHNNYSNNQKNYTHFKSNTIPKAADKISWGIKKIETGGVLVDFCFVDMLGMVIPRTYQAFTRNREELDGKLNIKNGTEELIREIFSGPSMFVIPMAFIALSKRLFGSSSNIQFKTFDTLSDIFKNSLNNSKSSTGLKENFYRSVFSEAFEKHKQIKPNNSKHIDDGIEKIVENLSKIENTKSNKAHIEEIKGIVSDLNKSHGINLDYSHNVTLKNGLTKEVGALTADMISYSKDVVDHVAGKVQEGISPDLIPDLLEQIIKSKTNGRKAILASTFLVTSAFLYSIPIMYKRNKQFPGIDGLVKDNDTLRCAPIKETSFTSTVNKEVFKKFAVNDKKQDNVSFSGNLSSADKLFRKLDFNGHNVPYPILAFYTLGLMLGCRLYQARNADERREVATRDFSGLTTIVFAIPVLRNFTSTQARKLSGFPIANPLKSLKNHFNPNNKPYSFENINDIYSGISKYKNNIVDFSENIENNGGDLRKIFDFLSDESKQALNDISARFSNNNIKVESKGLFAYLAKPFKTGKSELVLPASNEEIINILKQAQKDNTYKSVLQKVINEIDKPKNSLVKFAEALKSIPEAISIVAVSAFLGWFLPWFNINYTKKLYKDKDLASTKNQSTTKSSDFFQTTDKGYVRNY